MNQKTKQPFYKTFWFWMIIILFIVVVVGNSAPKKGSGQESQTAASASSSIDPLTTLIKSKVSPDYTLKVDDGYYELVYELNNTPYDYTDYVSHGLTHCLIVSKYLFENTDCYQLRADMKADGDIVTSFIITKYGFNERSWSDIAYTKGIYDDIQDSFIKFYVKSTLMKDVVTDDVMIKDMLED